MTPSRATYLKITPRSEKLLLNTSHSCYKRRLSQLNFNKFVIVFSGKTREDEVIGVILKQRNILFFSGFSQECRVDREKALVREAGRMYVCV